MHAAAQRDLWLVLGICSSRTGPHGLLAGGFLGNPGHLWWNLHWDFRKVSQWSAGLAWLSPQGWWPIYPSYLLVSGVKNKAHSQADPALLCYAWNRAGLGFRRCVFLHRSAFASQKLQLAFTQPYLWAGLETACDLSLCFYNVPYHTFTSILSDPYSTLVGVILFDRWGNWDVMSYFRSPNFWSHAYSIALSHTSGILSLLFLHGDNFLWGLKFLVTSPFVRSHIIMPVLRSWTLSTPSAMCSALERAGSLCFPLANHPVPQPLLLFSAYMILTPGASFLHISCCLLETFGWEKLIRQSTAFSENILCPILC